MYFTSLMIKLIFTIKSRIIFLMEVSRNALAGLGFFLACMWRITNLDILMMLI